MSISRRDLWLNVGACRHGIKHHVSSHQAMNNFTGYFTWCLLPNLCVEISQDVSQGNISRAPRFTWLYNFTHFFTGQKKCQFSYGQEAFCFIGWCVSCSNVPRYYVSPKISYRIIILSCNFVQGALLISNGVSQVVSHAKKIHMVFTGLLS